MAEEKKDSKSKIIIILVIVILLLIAGGAAAFIFLNNNNAGTNPEQTASITAAADNAPETTKNPLKLDYDAAAVALDEDSLQKQFDELKKNSEGSISLEYKNYISSKDGKEFECYIANSDLNTEDMFLAIFKDTSMEEQVYLSGLLKPGTAIENFTSDITIEPGEGALVLMFTSVADDHETMTSQIAVELKYKVG